MLNASAQVVLLAKEIAQVFESVDSSNATVILLPSSQSATVRSTFQSVKRCKIGFTNLTQEDVRVIGLNGVQFGL